MINRWFHRTRLPTPTMGHPKKVGWLELFYDLVYVATFIQLGNALAEHADLTGFLGFAALLVPVWYTWTGFTFFHNRFAVDDFAHRATVFVQMFAVAGVAISVPGTLGGETDGFAFCYATACSTTRRTSSTCPSATACSRSSCSARASSRCSPSWRAS